MAPIWTFWISVFLLWSSGWSRRLPICQDLASLGRRGVVSLVYTMETNCDVCYNEVNKLLTLKTQMAKFGHAFDVSIGADHLLGVQRGKLPPDLQVDVGHVWKKLGKQNGHIFVIDKCGKLAYQVISPWSKQMYPFTGMAVLSTIFDEPCGECNATIEAQTHSMPAGETNKGQHDAEMTRGDTMLKDGKIPITIVYRKKHDHIEGGRLVSYNVIELRTDDPEFHGHGEAAFSNMLEPFTEDTGSKNSKDNNLEDSRTTRILNDDAPMIRSEWATEDEDFGNQNVETSTAESSVDDQERRNLLQHYQFLMKWMNCAEQIMGI